MDRYSRIVAVLKVALPLSALALLSVLFFLSQSQDYTSQIPFADDEIAEMVESQRITAPIHATVTAGGDEIVIRATDASPQSADTRARANAVTARFTFASGGQADLEADRVTTTDRSNELRLMDNVRITSSLGYRLKTDLLDTATDVIDIRAPGPISGDSPLGRIDAGAMSASAKNGDGPIHMLFTDGVKLVYDPKQTERP